MLGRLLYHSFWNFYDHIGTLLLLGTVHALVSLGVAVLTLVAISGSAIGLPALILSGAVQLVLLVVIVSGLWPYCARAAKDQPARWVHFKTGIRTYWSVVTRILFLAVVVYVVLFVNVRFYTALQAELENSALQFPLVIVVALLAWSSFFLFIFLPPWLSAGTFNEERDTTRVILKRAFMAVALVPGTWATVGILNIALLIAGFYTRVGLIFYVPVVAVMSQTAYQLAAQQAEWLAASRDELGESANFRDLKRRAYEMGWEWEHKQPRRTFKELIRPWDY